MSHWPRPDAPTAFQNADTDFWYEFSEAALRIGLGELLLRCVPYWRIERVERGWAPGLELGGPGMPDRGDEVRIRSSEPLGLPWLSLTPPDPDGFVRRLSERLARACEDGTPLRAGAAR